MNIKKFHVIRTHAHPDAAARPYAVAHVTATRIAAVADAWKSVHVILSASVFRYGHAPSSRWRKVPLSRTYIAVTGLTSATNMTRARTHSAFTYGE